MSEALVFYDDIDIDILEHYGTPRHSGRYPWGSGENPYQRDHDFLANVYKLRQEGMSDVDIAKGLNMSTTTLRARISLANSNLRKERVTQAMELKAQGYSNSAIGREMGINESSVRSLLNTSIQERNDIAKNTAEVLKERVTDDRYLDVGVGVEYQLGISRTKLDVALKLLEEEGYSVQTIQEEQPGTGNMTKIKVLAPPGVTKKDIYKNKEKIDLVANVYSEDGGRTWEHIQPPTSIDSKRIAIKYAEDGGSDRDGLIELRPGKRDISLGDAQYAQVRIMVDQTHYLKGMAVYSDDLPPGVDIRFNTSKHKGLPMLGEDSDNSVLKPIKSDPDNPFGATVRQKKYIDIDGKEKLSALNIVYEEGEWSTWDKAISSQVLSKQQPSVAKEQLKLNLEAKVEEFNQLNALTNAAVKKKLMSEFADNCDSAAVELKGAAFPRQASHVILPVPSLKDNEIYAPNYRDGETVCLIRYPHAGRFEIPVLTVNNSNKEAKKFMENAIDAVGINPKAAKQLSGADFDGDTVLVIPNNDGKLKARSPLKELENFDHIDIYHNPPDAPKTGPKTGFRKQLQMGKVSNLITDMTIKGASDAEIAKAVKHSMVVIDAEKHNLDWKRSERENDIPALKMKYQGGRDAGASTLISRASSEQRVDHRKLKTPSKMTPEEYQRYLQGEKIWQYTGRTYNKPIRDDDGNIIGYSVKKKTMTSTKLAEVDDARKLSSGSQIEEIYAGYSNSLKMLANRARKAVIETPIPKYSPSAKKVYQKEVDSLNIKLNQALKHAPFERQAILMTNRIVAAKRKENPDMSKEDAKKLKGRTLAEARARYGGKKDLIDISEKEWEAIQAHALSYNKELMILNNANPEQVKKYATPREMQKWPRAKVAKMEAMLNRGYSRAEVADHFGISTSTLTHIMDEGA